MIYPGAPSFNTISKQIDLKSTFPPDPTERNASLLALCVLYEDLRLELGMLLEINMRREEIPRFGKKRNEFVSDEMRAVYFVRRITATILNLLEVFESLSNSGLLATLTSRLPPTSVSEMQEAENYLKQKIGHWREVRNNIGGHFGIKTCNEVINTWASETEGTIGRVEIQQEPGRPPGVAFPFAYQAVGTAMTRYSTGITDQQKLTEFTNELCKAIGKLLYPIINATLPELWPV